jgi:hypothetical protein
MHGTEALHQNQKSCVRLLKIVVFLRPVSFFLVPEKRRSRIPLPANSYAVKMHGGRPVLEEANEMVQNSCISMDIAIRGRPSCIFMA